MMQPGDNPPRVDLQTLPYSYLSTNLSSKLVMQFLLFFGLIIIVYCYFQINVTCQKVNSK